MRPEQKVNILLVDDRPENLLTLEAILSDPGQALVKARSGEEALRYLLQDEFAVIVLDIQMPGMDGFETAKQIRAREKLQNLPIIFLTAIYTSREYVSRGYSLGAVDYLFKPFEPEILKAKVQFFVDLFKKTQEVKYQAGLLQEINQKLDQSNQELERRVLERTAALWKAEQRFRRLATHAPVGIFETDLTGDCIFVNERWCAIAGLPPEDATGAGWVRALHPEDRESVSGRWYESTKAGREFACEYRFQTPAGKVTWVSGAAVALRDPAGEVTGFMGTCSDITERKQAEEHIKTSLREKEVLLQEIHHRVKNNLQIISSLVSLQSGYLKDRQALEFFKETQNRIRSIAIIHEKLYQSRDLAQIDFAAYVHDLVAHLFHSYGTSPEEVDLEVNIAEGSLSVNTAILCGLIVNELVSNSLKHAFPNGQKGLIGVGLGIEREDNGHQFTLTVRDNGVSLMEDAVSDRTPSLGLQLVSRIAKQLGGAIQLETKGGTRFRIIFKE
jgi:PAS domain S-box-containing protein